MLNNYPKDGIHLMNCREFHDEALNLLDENWQEMGMGSFDDLRLSINLDYYQALEDEGLGFTAVYRRGGKIVGYSSAHVAISAHNKNESFGSSDVIFFTKKQRNKGMAEELLRFVEDECYNRGASYFNLASNLNKGIGRWLMRKGYEPVEIVYFKKLGEH
jgi:GNAT superfamily N-acetyltransferase